jgi:hypothetical protein
VSELWGLFVWSKPVSELWGLFIWSELVFDFELRGLFVWSELVSGLWGLVVWFELVSELCGVNLCLNSADQEIFNEQPHSLPVTRPHSN